MILKNQAQKLLADETFLAIFVSIRTSQCNKFLHSGKDDIEVREEAHSILRALNQEYNNQSFLRC